MTELIVALDGTDLWPLAVRLHQRAEINWFKIGPLAMMSWDWAQLSHVGSDQGIKIFLDLKLADIADTVREAVKRFADAGIAAVGTYTEKATEAAAEAACGTGLKVWQVIRLTDGSDDLRGVRQLAADGVICPASMSSIYAGAGISIVVPGVRFFYRTDEGHVCTAHPAALARIGATHAVVGRPIWQAADPVAAAREFIAALGSPQWPPPRPPGARS